MVYLDVGASHAPAYLDEVSAGCNRGVGRQAIPAAQGRNPDYDLPDDQIEDRLRHAVGLICMSPSFQWR